MRSRLSFLRLIVNCCVLWALTSPTHAYNPGGDPPDVRSGHQWITNQAINYLKSIDPFAYALANRYREQLLYGAWFADRNSGICREEVSDNQWPCDSTNHYDPRFEFHPAPFLGIEGSVSASEYARDLFAVASDCWKWRNLPEEALPDSCQVPQWRAIDEDLVFGGFEQFEEDGPLIRKSPLVLLGWVLHLVQDVTVPYHTFSEPSGGHASFESNVDDFIRSGKGDRLPVDFLSGGLDVSSPKGFVEDIAAETRAIALQFPVAFGDIQFPGLIHCCSIDEDRFDRYATLTLNRAIIYSAKLLRFYLRKPASDLFSAIVTLIID